MTSTGQFKCIVVILSLFFTISASQREVNITRIDRAAIDARVHEAIETAGIILNEPSLSMHVSMIVANLVGIQPGTAPPYRIRLINSSELNAFSLSDGTVYISLGFFGMIENDAQLALLLAHEIAHVECDHHRLLRYELHKQSSSYLWSMGSSYSLRKALSGFSKSQERQADSVALKTVLTAGYNAWSAKELFATMYNWLRYREKKIAAAMATHPKLQQRYKAIKEYLIQNDIDSTIGITGEKSYGEVLKPYQERIITLLEQSNCVNELYTLALSRLDNKQPFPEWFYLRGSLLERYHPVDSFAVAHYSLNTALKMNPSSTQGLRTLGWLFLKNNKPDSARTYLAQYLIHTPQAVDTSLVRYYLELLNE